MTAPAAAPTSGPVAPAAPRAVPQPPADRFAFAAMLNSLPGAHAKAGASAGEQQAPPSNKSPQEESSRGQTAHHLLRNDSALLASLPFALRAASMMDDRPQAADDSPSLTSPAMKASKSEDSGASLSAGAKATTVGRLIGERAFHLGASTFAGVISSRTPATGAPFAQGAASAANLTPQDDLKGEKSSLPASRQMRPCQRDPWRAPFRHLQTRRPQRQSPHARARLHQTARASREPPRTRPGPADKSPKARRRPRSSGLRARPRPPSQPIEREDGRRSPARSDRVRSDAHGANKSVWRTALRAFFSRRVVPARRPANERRKRRRRATRERGPRQLGALARRSGRSTSIFRRAALRMSR